MIPINLHNPPRPLKPLNPILNKLLHPWSQFRLHQVKIIHCTYSHNSHTWEARADSIEEGAAGATEMVSHGVAWSADRFSGAVLSEVCEAAEVGQVGCADDEIGGEH